MPKILKAIGLMSGTSLDGIDAALLETDGQDIAKPGPALSIPYPPERRAQFRAALDTARHIEEGDPVPWSLRDAEQRLTELHAEAVGQLLQKARLTSHDVDLIGFHGQTILHRPKDRWTWQIGDGAHLARLTGIPTVNDFRSADVKAGGQGAPLVPLYHAALIKSAGLNAPCAVVNIGGVGNVTYCNGSAIHAFDTGPGNAPIDDWMQRHADLSYDESGAFAARGKIDSNVLERMLQHDFFSVSGPKSLDRFDFGMADVEHLSPEDGAATLTAFTAATIARARDHFPDRADIWIVCGGGRHNDTLMNDLRAHLNAPVLKAEDKNWRGDFIEAEAFAYLAVRSLLGLPLSLPSTTGVAHPITGGKLHKI